jgi:hypothetical protein
MPAVVIIAEVVVDYAATTAATAAIGSAIAGAVIGGAVAGAIGSEMTGHGGKDVWKGAVQGGVAGGLTAGISGSISPNQALQAGMTPESADIGITSAGRVTDVAQSSITGSAIADNAIRGAGKGAISGATQAAISGQNIGTGALKGAESGGVSGGVSTAATDVFGTSRLGQGASAGLGTYAGAEATGSNRTEALRAGLASGASTALFPTDPNASKSQQATTGFERQATSQALSQLLAPSSTGGKYQPSSGASSAVLGATQQASPGSAALAQALRVGDAGGPIFGSQGEDKKKKGAWNLESLRYMG